MLLGLCRSRCRDLTTCASAAGDRARARKPAISGVAFPDVTTQMELVTPAIWIMVLDCQVPGLAYFRSSAR
jgi:hypothetical protein